MAPAVARFAFSGVLHARMAYGFGTYTLRTTDPDGARAFYARVLGDASVIGEVTALPAPLAARGVPAHWLKHVCALGTGVAPLDVDAVTRTFVDAGAQQVGPTVGDRRILRDPGGAIFAISREVVAAPPAAIAWCELHTTDRVRASALYRAAFAWTAVDLIDVGPPLGAYELLAWADAPACGIAGGIDARPGVHPQWLHYAYVDDLERAAALVTELGGIVVPGVEVSATGARIAVCDDPQGAAFALWQR